MNKVVSIPVVLLLALTSVSCGSGAPDHEPRAGNTLVTLRLDKQAAPERIQERTAIRSIPYEIRRVVLIVSSPGMETLEQEVIIEEDAEFIEFSVQVPNGPARTFRVNAYDIWNPQCVLFTGSTTVDLDGTPIELAIEMLRVDSVPVFDGLQTAEAVGTTEVLLVWNPATDQETPPAGIEYRVFVAQASGGQDLESPAQTVTGETQLLVQNLEPGTTYYFVVRARNEAGCTDLNTVERAVTTPQEPDTEPPGFDGLQTAEATGTSTVELAWLEATDSVTPPEGIQYLVFVSQSPAGQNFLAPALTLTGETRVTVQGLLPATTYYFVVRARDEAGNTETNTVERAATTDPIEEEEDTEPPSFGGLQSASATGTGSVLLAWNAASDNVTPAAQIRYLVFVSQTSGGQDFASPSRTVTGETSAGMTGLQPATTYFFVVRARDEAGNTENNTVERSATTQPLEEPDTQPPSFGGLQSASASGTTSVFLSWNPASDNVTPPSQIRYLVFMAGTPGGQSFETPDEVVTGSLSTTVGGLDPDTTYYFVVRARDQAGNTDTNTVERSATTNPIEEEDIEPPVFGGLETAEPEPESSTSIFLSWSEADDNVTPPELIDYLVFVAGTPGGQSFETPDEVVTGSLSTTVGGLDPDTTYYFVVRARDQAGNTDTNTVERSATTNPIEEEDTDPPLFDGLEEAVTLGTFSVELYWTQATDNVTPQELIDYLVFIAESPESQNFASPAQVVTGVSDTVVTDLLPDRTYYFVVRARDEAGNTDQNTEELSATTDFYDHWLTTEELPVARLLSVAAAPGNGYVYIISGYVDSSACSMDTADGRVFFAPQDPEDGTLGEWVETTEPDTPANFRRSAAGVAQWDGFIYVGGGAINGPSWDGNIYYAEPEPDGTIPTWSLAPPLPGTPNWVGSWPFMAAHEGTLYVGGGRSRFSPTDPPEYSDRLYYTTLEPDGTPSDDWQQTDLPSPAAQGQLLFHQDRAYLILGIEGCDGCNTNRVYMAEVLPDGEGALGEWEETTPLPVPVNHPSAHFLWDMGLIILIPGGGRSVYLGWVDPEDGTLGEWVEWDPLPEVARPFDQGILTGEDYYLIGDQDCGASTERLRRVRHERFQF